MSHEYVAEGEREMPCLGKFLMPDGTKAIVSGIGMRRSFHITTKKGTYLGVREIILFTPVRGTRIPLDTYCIMLDPVEGAKFIKPAHELLDVFVPYGPQYSEEISMSQS